MKVKMVRIDDAWIDQELPVRPSPAHDRRSRILLADDEASVRESLARVLKTEDYEVVLARDGRDAVSKFLAAPCDLVLMDLNMPQLDGWEALEWITKMHPMVPVILITARPNQYE